MFIEGATFCHDYFTKGRSFVMKGFVYAEQIPYMIFEVNLLFGKLFTFFEKLMIT